MRKIRSTVAAIVAVAALSSGAAACTPVQQQQFGDFLGRLITFILFVNVYGDPLPPTGPPTTEPVTLPEPAGT